MVDVEGPVLGSHTTCGKFILVGEHFVVHGTPALAMPLHAVSTTVSVVANQGGDGPRLICDVDGDAEALAQRLFAAAMERLDISPRADWRVAVESTIPIGYGLGSSAAFSTALIGALARARGHALAPEQLNSAAHELERIVHGRPSGIDNTVVSRGEPVRFVRGTAPERIACGGELRFVLASCGYPGSTFEAVASVRRLSEAEPRRFAPLLAAATALVEHAQDAFSAGDAQRLGPLLAQNHSLLQQVGVSTAELDRIVGAALDAGALGAKLTGAGQGGFALALVAGRSEGAAVAAAMQAAGGSLPMTTILGGSRT